jgi:hypothetical protein
LRMRHAPFRIGVAERDAWLGHMRRAVDERPTAWSTAPATATDYLCCDEDRTGSRRVRDAQLRAPLRHPGAIRHR